ncbi:hypothetical protein ACOALZ_19260 [Nocardiopsis algeriensis]|uniref:hypothetical protein n=1 Tax=Nocardiopsis algeriensis TaxID=1478215 RepID=UPI003B42BAEF
MGIEIALRELYRAEGHMVEALLALSERHSGEHEIVHVSKDLARWSREHMRELARTGERYGMGLGSEGGEPLAEERDAVEGGPGDPDLELLADLRQLHRMASGVSVDWELLGQGAQALGDRELLHLTERCHPQTVRQATWANAMLKTTSPQVLTS